MMKNSHRSLGVALISAALALIATVLRCVASVTNMDYFTGFYGGSVLVDIANITITVSVLTALASLLLKVENTELRRNPHSPLWYIPAGIMTVSTLLLGIDIFSYVGSCARGDLIAAFSSDRSCIAAFLAALLAICAVAFFSVSCLTSDLTSSLRGYLGIAAALFFGIYAAFLFFRSGSAIHQPQKVVTEMAAIAASVFMLEETRVALGKERWNSYFALGTVTALISAYATFPAFAAYIVNGQMIAYSIAELLMLFSVFVFAVCRTVMAALPTNEKTTATEPTEEIPTEDERHITDEENSGN